MRHPMTDPAPMDATMQLVVRARQGDAEALEVLFERYVKPLQRWAAGRLPRWARDITDTQDLVQDTLLKTFTKIDAFDVRGEGALHAYLRQAVMNRIRDEIRRRERRGLNDPLDTAAPGNEPSPLEAAIGQQALERYEAALERLSPADREAVIAKMEFGCSYDEMAAALGKPSREAARKAAERALVRLAAEMKKPT